MDILFFSVPSEESKTPKRGEGRSTSNTSCDNTKNGSSEVSSWPAQICMSGISFCLKVWQKSSRAVSQFDGHINRCTCCLTGICTYQSNVPIVPSVFSMQENATKKYVIRKQKNCQSLLWIWAYLHLVVKNFCFFTLLYYTDYWGCTVGKKGRIFWKIFLAHCARWWDDYFCIVLSVCFFLSISFRRRRSRVSKLKRFFLSLRISWVQRVRLTKSWRNSKSLSFQLQMTQVPTRGTKRRFWMVSLSKVVVPNLHPKTRLRPLPAWLHQHNLHPQLRSIQGKAA